jgi:hypothetical protein
MPQKPIDADVVELRWTFTLLAAVDPSECKPNIYPISLPSAQRKRIPMPPSRKVRWVVFTHDGYLDGNDRGKKLVA